MAEFGPGSKTAAAVRFVAQILTGLPSILAGVFAYAAVVVVTGTFSAPAGGVALSLLMLPTVLLTAEDAIRMVPARMREAAIGMGATCNTGNFIGFATHGLAWHSHRSHAGGGPRRRGNRSLAFHCPL